MKNPFLMFVLFMFFLPACGGGNGPAESGAEKESAVRPRPGAPGESSREYRTGSGKAILVTETHPVGRSLSTIEIGTRGFGHNRPEKYEDRDPVSDVFVADLDGDGFDEIYIITTSQGSGSYGSVLGFASNRDKSLSTIHFPEVREGDSLFEGYMGHDVFAVEGRKLVRTFPLYGGSDRNSAPTGGERKIAYGLYRGEAAWQLRIEEPDPPE